MIKHISCFVISLGIMSLAGGANAATQPLLIDVEAFHELAHEAFAQISLPFDLMGDRSEQTRYDHVLKAGQRLGNTVTLLPAPFHVALLSGSGRVVNRRLRLHLFAYGRVDRKGYREIFADNQGRVRPFYPPPGWLDLGVDFWVEAPLSAAKNADPQWSLVGTPRFSPGNMHMTSPPTFFYPQPFWPGMHLVLSTGLRPMPSVTQDDRGIFAPPGKEVDVKQFWVGPNALYAILGLPSHSGVGGVSRRAELKLSLAPKSFLAPLSERTLLPPRATRCQRLIGTLQQATAR